MSKPSKTNTRTNFAAHFLDSAAFDKADFPLDWLVEGVLVRGQPGVIGGPKKSLKTSLAVDLAISLGSGTPFLDEFPVPERVRVALLSGESGAASVKETARRVCEAKGVRLKDCAVHWSFRLPRLSSKEDRRGLTEYLLEEKIVVVLIDPLYLCLLPSGRGAAASNLYAIGPLLQRAGRACLDAGATPVLIHHTTKSRAKTAAPPGPLDLDDLAFAGIAEYARQWVLVNPREPFRPETGEHRLWMVAGGSAGHAGRWTVDVTEGVLGKAFQGRTWEVQVGARTPAPVRRVKGTGARAKARPDDVFDLG